MTDKIGIFSFFAGAGFLDLGFERTEKFETLFVNEYHKAFVDIYKGARKNLNIPEPKFGYDISDITSFLEKSKMQLLQNQIEDCKKLNKTIGFIGGPPCPDFSIGGKNKGKHGENGKLSGTYIELICRTQPDFFLFENVKGLYRTKKHREFFDSLKVKLRSSGYFLSEKLINAIEYGAPQDRERIILIGFHKNSLPGSYSGDDQDQALKGFVWSNNLIHRAKDIFDIGWPQIEPFNEGGKKMIPIGVIPELTVQHWFDKNDVENHPNSKHHFTPRNGLSKFQSIPEGDDLKKSYKRLHRWRYSPTAAYGNNEVHLHPYKARRITVAEALAIQSLPKEFVIPSNISLTDMFKTIGNGVPFLAAQGLALNIFEYINKLKQGEHKTLYAEVNSQ